MNSIFRKLQVSFTQQAFALGRALALCRATPSIQHPVWGAASVNERQFRSMPTHGIGRWRYLIKKKGQPRVRKRDRNQMKPIIPATDTAYGTLNMTVSGYDMTLVEHYTQYIHHLCNRLGIKVGQCYALQTKNTEVLIKQEQGNKFNVDAVLNTHQRVIQLPYLNTTVCPIFMDVVLKNQPEGVQLSVMEHTEAHFKSRFKSRPELEELLAKMNQRDL